MGSSSEGDADCAICCNELDLTDRSIQYCACGFQPCLWCYHHILEEAGKESLPARCPNCRSEYDQNKISMQHIDAEMLEEEKRKLREKDRPKGAPTRVSRANLANVRVVQPNLVYVVGLPMDICHEDVLKDQEFFGQFGKTVKVSVNRSNQYASALAKHGPTGSAYVTFKRSEDALRCIKCSDGALWRGKPVKACFGTTKYCNAFLRGIPCNNPDCLYLHELADEADCLTKDEVAAGLLPARFLAMGASNTFKPRLTINVIPNPATVAAQQAAAAAAAAGQPPAVIAAAAAAAGGISRQQSQQQSGQQQQQQQQAGTSAPRVLTVPAAALRASSSGTQPGQQQQQQQQTQQPHHHQQQQALPRQDSSASSSSAAAVAGGVWGSPARSGSVMSSVISSTAAGSASATKSSWAIAASGAPSAAPGAAAAATQHPPPASSNQEWPTLAGPPGAEGGAEAATSARGEPVARLPSLGQSGTMAEQLARAHSNPPEAKAARQAKKLLALSSPAKLKPLGKAVQRPASSSQEAPGVAAPGGAAAPDGRTAASGGAANSGAAAGVRAEAPAEDPRPNGDSGGSALFSRLAVGFSECPGPAPAALAATRGPPPGFGGPVIPPVGGGQQPRPKKVTPPPGFGGSPSAGAPPLASIDSASQLYVEAAPEAGAYAPFGGGRGMFEAPGGAPADPFAGPGAHLAAAGVGDAAATPAAPAAGAGAGRRQKSRFAFAQAEGDSPVRTLQAGFGAAASRPVPPPLQFAALPARVEAPPPRQPPPLRASPGEDAGAFFRSLFPSANVNVASSAASAPAQRPALPPGFGGALPPPAAGNVPLAAPMPASLYNPLAGMFPAQPPPPGQQQYQPQQYLAPPAPPQQCQQYQPQQAANTGLAPGLALLRQLQGGALQQPLAGSGLLDPAIMATRPAAPPGFSGGGGAASCAGLPSGFGLQL